MPLEVHNFKDSLAFSQKYEQAEWWEENYKKAFPDFMAMHTVKEAGWAQQGGVDRVIILKSGKTILVDEKVRKRDSEDILLEYWSVEEKKKPGWIEKDLATDYIAYVFLPSQICYLLPFQLLRKVWEENKTEWIRRSKDKKDKSFTHVRAENNWNGGKDHSCGVAIPIYILMNKLKEASIICWGEY